MAGVLDAVADGVTGADGRPAPPRSAHDALVACDWRQSRDAPTPLGRYATVFG